VLLGHSRSLFNILQFTIEFAGTLVRGQRALVARPLVRLRCGRLLELPSGSRLDLGLLLSDTLDPNRLLDARAP
jgi:hypothetical protein